MTSAGTGNGTADMHAAVTIINATATGHGAALGVVGGVEATWTVVEDHDRLEWATPDMDDRLALSVHGILRDQYHATAGATVRTSSTFPASRGLKTSSGAAAAMMLAGAQAHGVPMSVERLLRRSVEASIAAGVTVTGAFDDQVAVVQGGCHLTDNVAGRILEEIKPGAWHVAVWVPDATITKDRVAKLDATRVAKDIRKAEARLLEGDIPGAMTLNGRAFTKLYTNAGLPVRAEPADIALRHGALGAGLSGTGPAVAALFDDQVDLPAVDGGKWQWTVVAG